MLTHAAYGKSEVRMVQVRRAGDRHDLVDLTVSIRFAGAYQSTYRDGDNRELLPTDSMKNTDYALAAAVSREAPEAFGVRLARHFLAHNPPLGEATITVVEHAWHRVTLGGREHGCAFVRGGPDSRTATIVAARDEIQVAAGVENLLLLKTAASRFVDFKRDQYTTPACPDSSAHFCCR